MRARSPNAAPSFAGRVAASLRGALPRQAVRDGIAYVTEDRKVDGVFETMTVDQNIYRGFLSSPRARRFLYSTGEMTRRRPLDRIFLHPVG